MFVIEMLEHWSSKSGLNWDQWWHSDQAVAHFERMWKGDITRAAKLD